MCSLMLHLDVGVSDVWQKKEADSTCGTQSAKNKEGRHFQSLMATISNSSLIKIDEGLKKYYESLNREYEITENGGKFRQLVEVCGYMNKV